MLLPSSTTLLATNLATMTRSSGEEITYETFSTICRCCILNKGDVNVFEAYIGDSAFSTIIFNYTNEMISKTDGLPKGICDGCMQLLMNFHLFVQTFKEAQKNLRNMYQMFTTRKNADEVKKPAKQIEMNRNGTIQEIPNGFSKKQEDLDKAYGFVVTAVETLKDGRNDSYSSEVIEDIYLEICDSDLSNNIEFVEYTKHNKTEEEPNLNRNKTVENIKRVEVDPLLTSGLDLQCFQCLEVFSTNAEMARHHRVTGHTMAPNYKCDICAKTMSTRKAYWDHMAMHRHLRKKAVCEVCGEVVLSLHLKRHMLVHQEKSHVCQFCGRGYVQKSTLEDHVRRKHGGQPKETSTLCFICGKLFGDLKSLTTHLNTHNGATSQNLSHQCQECGKGFLNSQSLKTHTFMAHKSASRMLKRRIKFQNCNRTLERELLPKRVRVKREPLECPICHKFISHVGFTRHLTRHTEEKPHQCEHCSKSFRLFSSLKSHMNVHSDLYKYKCDVCGVQFRYAMTLKVHKRVHTGEKPAKGFINISELRTHQRIMQHEFVSDIK